MGNHSVIGTIVERVVICDWFSILYVSWFHVIFAEILGLEGGDGK